MDIRNAETRAVIDACAKASHEGRLDFGTGLGRLAGVGVESYLADYRRGETTYYLLGGETHTVALTPPEVPVAEAFDVEALREAIRGSQLGHVQYPEFLRRSRAAGCVGYFVWIAGRHVRYLGRRGETHVEPFPPAS